MTRATILPPVLKPDYFLPWLVNKLKSRKIINGKHTMNPAVSKVLGKSSGLISRRVKLESARLTQLSLNIDNSHIC